MAGPIERGLRADLRKHRVKTTGSVHVALALKLAGLLDMGLVEDKNLAALTRELRLTVDKIMESAPAEADEVEDLQTRAAQKQ
jgi:hypothetical protein